MGTVPMHRWLHFWWLAIPLLSLLGIFSFSVACSSESNSIYNPVQSTSTTAVLATPASTKTPVSSPTTIQWKTYANPEYSYQITVPQDWIYRENEQPDHVMFRSPNGLATAEVLVGSSTTSPSELLASMLKEALLENPSGVEVIFEPDDVLVGDASVSEVKQSYTRFRIAESDESCAEDFRTIVTTTGVQSFWVVTSACEDVIETYGPIIDKILWSLDIGS